MGFEVNLLEFIKLATDGLVIVIVVHLVDFTERLDEGSRASCCVQIGRSLA